MLVLTRKSDQEVLLGDNIRLRVLSIRGNTVRIGIEAPHSVNIKRGELVKSQCFLPISSAPEWADSDSAQMPSQG